MKKKLLNGEKKIYIATKLFNICDKMAGNTLERKVYEILKNCVSDEGSVLEVYPLYLPFRDTNEDQLLKCDNAFQVIYDADISRLEHLHSLLKGDNRLAILSFHVECVAVMTRIKKQNCDI